MTYTFSWQWLVGGIFVYIAAFCFITFFCLLVFDDVKLSRITQKTLERIVVVVAVLLAPILASVLTWSFGTKSSPGEVSKASAAASALGLTSNVGYPVVIGRQVDGSIGSAYVYGGLFSTEARTTLQPGSSISMNFQSGTSSYILQVPVSKISFRQTSGSSRVTFFIDNKLGVDADGNYRKYGSYKRHDCQPVVKSVILAPSCIDTLVLDEGTRRRGLAPIVAEHLDSAIVELSPDLYRKILGTP